MLDNQMQKLKVGIVFSGGGSRGFAHVGVIRALGERGIVPQAVSGTSAGAIVAALYADGYTPDEMLEFFGGRKLTDFTGWGLSRRGVFTLEKFGKALHEHLRHKTFEEMPIPLFVSASNLNTGRSTYFHSGTIADKIVASAAVPVLFSPVEIDGYTYVDGGLLENLPVTPLRNMCDFVIGVNVNPPEKVEKFTSFMHINEQTMHVLVQRNTADSMCQCDLIIEPKGLLEYRFLDMKNRFKIAEAGYKQAKVQLDKMGEIFAN